MELNISTQYSDMLGARSGKREEYPGDIFYKELLKPYYLKAVENNEKLVINLDGTYGYPSSFIDESFGGLSREFGSQKVLNVIQFISKDQPGLIDVITENIRNPYNYNKNRAKKYEES